MASIFSRIIAGEIPSYKIYEDEAHFAFLDINPLTKGHTLVIPKVEQDYIFDLSDEAIANLMVTAKRIAAQLKSKLECKRVAVVVIGLEVPHAHIHLIPIENEGDVDFKRERVKLSGDEFLALSKQLYFEL